MKKPLALLVVALLTISIPVAISLQVPRQVDPSTAPADTVYGQGLYLFYGSIVAALTGGNFTAARHLLHQTPFIHIPPEIIDAVNSFNGLVNSTTNLFSTINRQLDNTSTYIATGRILTARATLQGAIVNLRSANQTLTQLFGAEPQLAALTGIPSSLLLQKLQPLDALYKADFAESNRLLKVITGLTKLDQPLVSIAVLQTSIETGSNISVSGHLSAPSGSSLGSRRVTVFYADQAIGQATTDATGSYVGTFRTPFYYQPTAPVFTSFIPVANDTLVYAPAVSETASVNVTFSKPTLTLVSPKVAYAGLELRLNGTLTINGVPLSGYGVTLSGFKVTAAATTSRAGSFSLRVTVSTSLVQGTYPVTLQTSPNRTIGPQTSTVHVRLIKEDPTVTSNVPIIAIAGLPITISGSATVNGSALAGARLLNTSPSPAVNTTTTSGGSFSFTVTPPITATNGGWSYTVEVYPSQSWITPAPVNVSVFVINPLVLALPVSSLGFLALVVRRRRQPAPLARVVAPNEAVVSPIEMPVRPPLTGIPAIYAEAVQLLTKATSIALQPELTVREYLSLLRGKANGLRHFEYISSALESQLYGPGVYKEVEEWARKELNQLREELEG